MRAAWTALEGAANVSLTNFDDIDESYLAAICDDSTHESQTLEFKLELPRKDDRYELHKDLSALANSEGGDLVYGIAESAGAASRIVPMRSTEIDGCRRRITQAADAIEPRLQGLKFLKVSVTGGHVLIVRVPASFDGPHSYRVEGGARKFVLRNGTDTSDMNVDQIRSAFDRTATLAERARQFLAIRMDEVSNGRGRRRITRSPVAAVAIVPIAGLAGRASVDIGLLKRDRKAFAVTGLQMTRLMNLDGMEVVAELEAGTHHVTQIYRSGTVFSMQSVARLDGRAHLSRVIPSRPLTEFYRNLLIEGFTQLTQRGVSGPAVVQLALTGVAHHELTVGGSSPTMGGHLSGTDRNVLIMPDTWVESMEAAVRPEDVDTVLRPLLDILWQAFNWDRCLEYDECGQWISTR